MICDVLMENQCNTQGMVKVSSMDGIMMQDLLHNTNQLAVGNRADGLGQDFVNENIEMVRKLSFAMQLSDPDDYEGGNVQLLDEAGN